MKDFRQELYKNGYFRQEELCFADCDRYQRARVSGLLNKAAAYAGYDYNARGLTHDVLFEMGEVFLLSRLAMRIHRIPMAGEVLDIATYENGVKGAHMQRVYEMKNQTGAGVGEKRLDLSEPRYPEDHAALRLHRQAHTDLRPDHRLSGPEKAPAAPRGGGGAGDPASGLVRSGRQRPPLQRQLRRHYLGLSAPGPSGAGSP